MQIYQRVNKYQISAVIWMGVIFCMSTGPFSSAYTSRIIEPMLHFLLPQLSDHQLHLIHGIIRKAGHVTEYFILGVLLFRAFRGNAVERWQPRWAIYTIAVLVFYAATDEYHQSFVASRTASVVDVGIDSIGGLLSVAAVIIRQKIEK